ncbi:MAG: RNA polymerase sigma factor [Gammaproteobacteria bacterium]
MPMIDQLMQRIASGERKALEHLYAQMSQPLHAYLRRMGASRDDAADLLQTVFLKLWQRRSQYAGSQASAWIYRITHNAWLDHARKWRHWNPQTAEDQQSDPSPEQNVMAEQLGERLQHALESLPEETREAILLSRFSDLSLAEIAHVLGTSEGNVKVRIHRGLSALKTCLQEETHVTE